MINRASVLELGCGTGRILVALLDLCASIVGVDISQSMLDLCEEKVRGAGEPGTMAEIIHCDMCRLALGRRFDLIIAPGRVFQNLESDQQADQFFGVVREHLSATGTCVLDAFNPNAARADLVARWRQAIPGEEIDTSEVDFESGMLRQSFRRVRLQEDPLVLYSELIHTYIRGGDVIFRESFIVAQRVWYPDELLRVVEDHGFAVARTWGGYGGEIYGEGKELLVEFESPPRHAHRH